MAKFQIDQKECNSCGVCEEACPVGAIEFIPDFGNLPSLFVITTENCNGCGDCVAACINNAIIEL